MENTPTPEPAPVAPAPAPAPDAGQPLFANNNGGAPKKSHTGLIVGIVIGIIAIAAILVVLFAVILPSINKDEDKDKKNDNTSQNTGKDDPTPTPTPTPDPDPTPTPTPTPDPDPTPTPTPTTGTKVLTCTNTASSTSDARTDVKAILTYKNGTLIKAEIIEEDWQKSGFTDEDLKAAQKENNPYYDANKYDKWVARRKDANTIILETEVKLVESNINNIDTYEKAKSQLTSSGYTCD